MNVRRACPGWEGADGLESMVERLLELSRGGRGVLAALDGRCAAGKTTLARALGARYGWSLVHMDYFFLRPEQRTPERLETPGENVDHQRFLEEVLRPIREGRSACYRPFDCHTLSMAPPVRVEPGRVTLVEGAYCCHRSLWPYYDLRAFLTVEPALQRERILARNGPEGLRVFQEKWIPLEEAYIAAQELEQRCDFLLDAGGLPDLP